MKQKIKVITYNQMAALLAKMIADGVRSGEEPFMVNGDYIEMVEDSRNGGAILCRGELEIERNIPPLNL